MAHRLWGNLLFVGRTDSLSKEAWQAAQPTKKPLQTPREPMSFSKKGLKKI
jgi:hypothetical protein